MVAAGDTVDGVAGYMPQMFGVSLSRAINGGCWNVMLKTASLRSIFTRTTVFVSPFYANSITYDQINDLLYMLVTGLGLHEFLLKHVLTKPFYLFCSSSIFHSTIYAWWKINVLDWKAKHG